MGGVPCFRGGDKSIKRWRFIDFNCGGPLMSWEEEKEEVRGRERREKELAG